MFCLLSGVLNRKKICKRKFLSIFVSNLNFVLFKENHTLNYDEEPMHITSIGVHIPGIHVDWVILNVIESVN